MFYPKTDPEFSDARLRELKSMAPQVAASRLSEAAAAAAAAGFVGPVALVAVGTYHAVYRVDGISPAIVRMTIPGLFVQDRSLLLDGWVRGWLSNASAQPLVPEVYAVYFGTDAVPFDISVSARAEGQPLDDAELDSNPDYLAAIGQTLRVVHAVEGRGAGLLALDAEEPPTMPEGVHDRWASYIEVRLDEHVAVCIEGGYIADDQARRITRLFDLMRSVLATRPMRLLHGDPSVRNMFVDARGSRLTALFDWEDALVGDPLFDVAMWSSFHPPRRVSAFLSGYGLPSPTPDEQRLIALYFLRIGLSKTVHRHRFAVADLPGRTPGHHRILRGLEELERLC